MRWNYDKTENETALLDPVFWHKFDYVLAERPEKVIGAWEVVDVVDGFAGVKVLRLGDWDGDEMEDGEQRSRKRGLEGWSLKLWNLWTRFEKLMRRRVTGGWWVQARMEPQIRILKKVEISGIPTV